MDLSPLELLTNEALLKEYEDLLTNLQDDNAKDKKLMLYEDDDSINKSTNSIGVEYILSNNFNNNFSEPNQTFSLFTNSPIINLQEIPSLINNEVNLINHENYISNKPIAIEKSKKTKKNITVKSEKVYDRKNPYIEEQEFLEEEKKFNEFNLSLTNLFYNSFIDTEYTDNKIVKAIKLYDGINRCSNEIILTMEFTTIFELKKELSLDLIKNIKQIDEKIDKYFGKQKRKSREPKEISHLDLEARIKEQHRIYCRTYRNKNVEVRKKLKKFHGGLEMLRDCMCMESKIEKTNNIVEDIEKCFIQAVLDNEKIALTFAITRNLPIPSAYLMNNT